MNFGIDCCRFLGRFGDRFSDLLGMENRLENRGIFGDVTGPEPRIWRSGSTADLGPLKKQQHSPIAEKHDR